MSYTTKAIQAARAFNYAPTVSNAKAAIQTHNNLVKAKLKGATFLKSVPAGHGTPVNGLMFGGRAVNPNRY